MVVDEVAPDWNISTEKVIHETESLLKVQQIVLTDMFELPGVVPYPEDGKDATDHRLPSPR